MKLSELYKALADDNRLRLLGVLGAGFFNVQELTTILEISQPTVSHHLKLLQNAGLLSAHREGTWSFYGLANGDATNSTTAAQLLKEIQIQLKDNPPPGSIDDAVRVQKVLDARRKQSLQFFETVAPQWSALQNSGELCGSYFDPIISEIKGGDTVLDLGCGTGALIERIGARATPIIGIDYSPAMLEEARQSCNRLKIAADLRLGALEHLPVADETADIAAAHMVFHHVSNPAVVLTDVYRVVKPGGRIVIVDLVKHEHEYMRERYADQWLGFDLEQFSGWVTAAGFGCVAVKYLGENKSVFFITAIKEQK